VAHPLSLRAAMTLAEQLTRLRVRCA